MPSDGDTWPERMEAACRVMESEFGISLQTERSETKSHLTSTPLSDRLRYFKQRLRTKTRPVSIFCAKRPDETHGDQTNVERYSFGGVIYANFGLFAACVDYPDQPDNVHERVFAALGDALGAHTAQYLPLAAEARLRAAHACVVIEDKIHFENLVDKTREEAALPWVRDCHYSGLTHPLQPSRFGWLNYWSADVCKYVAFPERLGEHPLMEHCYQTQRGAWVVKLGNAPFEPANPGQMVLLREMYDRFPLVGVRMGRRSDEIPSL